MTNLTLRDWIVPLYLVAQSLGSGLVILLSAIVLFGELPIDAATIIIGGFSALLFVIVALGAYVYAARARYSPFQSHLTFAKPCRELYGLCSIIGLTLLIALWWILEYAATTGWLAAERVEMGRVPFLWAGLLGAVVTAVFPAFLLGHAPQVALWRSTLLPPHLVLRALLAGSSFYLMLGAVVPLADPLLQLAAFVFTLALLVNVLCLLGEFGTKRATAAAIQSVRQITRGAYRDIFWWGVLGLGHVAPLGLLLLEHPLLRAQAGLYVLAGLLCYEYAYIAAPRRVALLAEQHDSADAPTPLPEPTQSKPG